MALRVRDILTFPDLDGVRPIGQAGLDRQVRWVHTWPEVLPWLHGGELLLTTAYSWPSDPAEQRRIVRDLAQAGVAAILFRAGGEFFPAIPPAVVEEAELAGLAVLEATQDVSFVDLTETINRAIIRTHFEALERSERINRALTEAALVATTVRDLAQRLEGLLGRQTLVVDSRGRLLAGDEDLFGRVAPALDGLAIPEGGTALQDLPDGTRLVRWPVRTGDGIPAQLVLVVPPGEPLRDVDRRAAEHAALVMGLHFLRQQAVADVEARVRSTFVEAALQGRLADDPSLRERAQLLGFDLRVPYAVGVTVPLDSEGRATVRPLTSTEDFRQRHRLAEAVSHGLRSLGLPVFTALQLNQVVVLLPADAPAPVLRDRAQALHTGVRAYEPAPVAISVGRPYPDPNHLRRSLEEAQALLPLVRGAGVWWYEDALVLRILHACHDRAALQALYGSTLGRLRASSPALYATALALVASGFNQRAAARALGVHWNTLRYRIARLEEVLGGRLDDPHLRLRLHLSALWENVRSQPPQTVP